MVFSGGDDDDDESFMQVSPLNKARIISGSIQTLF